MDCYDLNCSCRNSWCNVVEFLMSLETDFPLVIETQLFLTDCTHFSRPSYFFILGTLFSFNIRPTIIISIFMQCLAYRWNLGRPNRMHSNEIYKTDSLNKCIVENHCRELGIRLSSFYNDGDVKMPGKTCVVCSIKYNSECATYYWQAGVYPLCVLCLNDRRSFSVK